MSEVKTNEIKVRIAPSPTGYLHIGTARTALFNWFFARHHGGKLVLRVEDTDIERSKKEFEDDIIKGLEWLGLEWNEFYRQSDRSKIYSKYIKKLLESGKAFWCYHSKDELERERQEQASAKGIPRHVCKFKLQTTPSRFATGQANHPEGVASRPYGAGKSQNLEKDKGVIRLAVDENSDRKIEFDDIIRGHIEFEQKIFGDFSIAKDEEHALYHFAVVVDDYETDITHIIRGEDHIANTAKHLLIQEALGFDRPQYAHMPMILAPDKSKLSKRHGATSLSEYRDKGYLPDALINYLALLGWTPKEAARARSGPLPPTGWTPKDGQHEIMDKEEIIKQFALEKVHKSGAVFDIKKLNWVNSQYIKAKTDEDLVELVRPFIDKHFGEQDIEIIKKMTSLLRERLEYLDQIQEFHFFFKEPEYDAELLRWKDSPDEQIKNSLNAVHDLVAKNGTDNKDELRKNLDELGKSIENRGLAYWPFRVALTGEKTSPDPVDISSILGKEKTLERITKAIQKLD